MILDQSQSTWWIDRRYDQWREVLPVVGDAWTEEGVERLGEGMSGERIDMASGLRVVERHPAPLVVNVNPDPLGAPPQGEQD